jgi:tape measure domain-containing protein
MAFDVGAIVGRIVLQDNFTEPIKKAGQASQTFATNVNKTSDAVDNAAKEMIDSFDDVESSAVSLRDVLSGIGAGLSVAGITAAFAAVSSAGAAMEQTLVSYKTLLGGSEAATRALVNELNSLANVTPYTNDQILKAGKQLLAFGANADEIADRLRIIGDIAAGTGKDFNELALIYGKAMTAGVVQAEELNQLSEAGVPIIKQLAQQFKVAESEVKKLGSEGKIRFTDLHQAFADMTSQGGLFFNMMQEQSATFNGVLSTIQGTFGSLLSDIGMTLNNLLKPALLAVNAAVQGMLEAWMSLSQPVKDMIVTFVTVGTAIGALVLALPLLISGIQAAGAAITAAFVTNPVGLIITGIAAAVAVLTAAIFKLYREWDRFASFFAPVTDLLMQARDAFNRLMDVISVKSMSGIIEKITSMTEGIDIFASVIKAALFPTVAMITALTGGFRTLYTLITGLVSAASPLIAIIREIGLMLKALISTEGLIGWVQDGGPERMRAAFESMGKGMVDALRQSGQVAIDTGYNIRKLFNDIITKSPEAAEKIDETTEAMVDLKEQATEAAKATGEIAGETLAGAFSKSLTKGFAKIALDNWFPGNAYLKEIYDQAEKIDEGLRKVFDGAMKNMELQSRLTIEKIRSTIDKISFFEDVALLRMKQRHEREIKMIEQTENAKIAILRSAHTERMALLSEEFAARKRAIERERDDFIKAERRQFEQKLAIMEREQQSERLRALNRTQMEEDWRLYVERINAEYNRRILDSEAEKNERIKAGNDELSLAIQAAEEAKNAALTEAQQRHAEEEARVKKQGLIMRTMLEYRAFQASKQLQLAQATISYAMSIMSAVQAGASLAAALPLIGPFLGPALTAALIAQATQAYHLSRALISSQQYIPPAELFAAEGGVIQGPRHAQGGVMVNAEGGEAFLSRDLTTRLDQYISEPKNSVAINIEPGAIVVNGNMDSVMIDRLAAALAERVQQRLY